MTALVPHFAWPFRIDSTGSAAVVEQDTWEDVAQCVQILLTTVQGDRLELPDYGIPSPLFDTLDSFDSTGILSLIDHWEKRAQATLDITTDNIDELVRHIEVRLLDIIGDSGHQSA
jgi:phage baseplate assembly protein W